jgi:rubredoxin
MNPYRCPTCGWAANDDEPEQRIARTQPEYNAAKSEQFGVEALDWEETWLCPRCQRAFSFKNSNV